MAAWRTVAESTAYRCPCRLTLQTSRRHPSAACGEVVQDVHNAEHAFTCSSCCCCAAAVTWPCSAACCCSIAVASRSSCCSSSTSSLAAAAAASNADASAAAAACTCAMLAWMSFRARRVRATSWRAAVVSWFQLQQQAARRSRGAVGGREHRHVQLAAGAAMELHACGWCR